MDRTIEPKLDQFHQGLRAGYNGCHPLMPGRALRTTLINRLPCCFSQRYLTYDLAI